jgi:GntR family transcriptional regulator, carbon starvation induced regulator
MPPKSRTAETYERIKRDILDGRFLPNDKLRVDHISAALDVSPGAVREALSRLTSEGLVVAEVQKGFAAAPVSASDLRDLTEVRIEVEVKCLASAIAHGTVEWEANLLAAHHQLVRTPKLAGCGDNVRLNKAWADMHSAFHAALVADCTNQWRLRLRTQLFTQSERYRCLLAPSGEGIDRDVDHEHEEIMSATLTRDTPRACALLAAHLQKTADLLLSGASGQKAGDEITRLMVP